MWILYHPFHYETKGMKSRLATTLHKIGLNENINKSFLQVLFKNNEKAFFSFSTRDRAFFDIII